MNLMSLLKFLKDQTTNTKSTKKRALLNSTVPTTHRLPSRTTTALPRKHFIVLTTFPLQTGILVNVRPVAVMEMIDSGESDYKVIAVPTEDKRWEDTQDLADINKHTIKEFQHFMETYKALKGKPALVEIKGIKGKADAMEAVKKSVELYKAKFAK
jgi:hypothetical protein